MVSFVCGPLGDGCSCIYICLTMPSVSLFIPWSSTLNRMAARAAPTSSSGGPSRTSLSKLKGSAADGVLLTAARLAKDVDELAGRRAGGLALPLASELDLCLCGDRLRAWRRVGETSLECTSRSFCRASTADEVGMPEMMPDMPEILVMPVMAAILLAAPRLCADWSLRSVLCVRGVRGVGSSMPSDGGGKREGIVPLVGLGIVPLAFRDSRSSWSRFRRRRNSRAERGVFSLLTSLGRSRNGCCLKMGKF